MWVFLSACVCVTGKSLVGKSDRSLCFQDPGREIDKLCSFLGLSPSIEKKEQLLDRVRFDNMKKDKVVDYSTFQRMNLKISPFIRKGTVNISTQYIQAKQK